MTGLRHVALALVLLAGCTSASDPGRTTDPQASAAADTLRYPSATADDRGAVLAYDLDELGELPVGTPGDSVLARYGAPDTDDRYDLDVDFPGGEMRVEVYNTTRDREARGEDVHVRELTWRLPNGWLRKVWLHDAPGGWAVADAVEWAADRVEF